MGTVVGTITNSLGGALSGIHVVVTPSGGTALTAVTTSANGAFVANSVPTSTEVGSVAVSALPANCATPLSSSYTGLTSGDTVTVNITVVCSSLVATVKGTVTSSLGGGLAGAGVVVTPHAGTALAPVPTNTSGAFVVANVPVADSTGTVAVTTVPTACTLPASPTNYAKLGYGDTVSVAITVTCTSTVGPGTGTVSGTVTSSLGGPLGGVQVVVTPSGAAALPAVTTTGAGVYSVSNVPVGSGAVTLTSGLPGQCSAPSAVAYTGLTKNGTATANVVAPCQQLGSLTVTITPYTLAPVTVTGPAGYSQAITQTTTLSGLVPGSYSVSAASFEVPQTFVGVMYDGAVTGSPATVTASGTSNVSVSYAIRGGSGALWAFSGFNVSYQISNAQLAANGSVTTSYGAPNGGMQVGSALVDKSGTLWLVGTNHSCGPFCPGPSSWAGIFGCTPADLAGGHLNACSDSLDLGLISSAPSGAFDAAGNLWFIGGVPIFGGYALYELTPAQLAAGGAQAPTASFSLGGLSLPTAMVIGPHGDVWVGTTGGFFGSLSGYSVPQIVAPGAPVPSSIPLRGYVSGMAFDPSGNLWVSEQDSNRIVMFTPSQLAAGGVQTATVILGGVGSPAGLAFDGSGDLWVLGQTAQRLFGFSSFQLTASGSPTPQVSISFLTSIYPNVLAFDPHSASVPLNGSRVISRRPLPSVTRVVRRHK